MTLTLTKEEYTRGVYVYLNNKKPMFHLADIGFAAVESFLPPDNIEAPHGVVVNVSDGFFVIKHGYDCRTLSEIGNRAINDYLIEVGDKTDTESEDLPDITDLLM